MKQSDARKIMGLNYFGIEEAINCFGIVPKKEELASLENVPFTWKLLRRVKKTHILVAVFPLSINEIRARVRGNLFTVSWNRFQEDFIDEKEPACWRLVRRKMIVESVIKSWDEQKKLLSEIEKVPTARVLVYTIMGQCLARDVFLCEWGWVRTSSTKGGYNISIGEFHHLDGILYQFSCGLGIRLDYPDHRLGNLGISSSIEPQFKK